MKYKSRKSWCGFRPSNAIARDDEQPVQNGLSVTPSEMERLTQEGIPISASNSMLLKSYDVGDNDFSVPLEFRRGVDPLADGYQQMKEVHSKIGSLFSDNKKKVNVTETIDE